MLSYLIPGITYGFAAAGTLGPRVRKNLIGLSSIGLAGLGFYQIWLGVSAFSKAS